MSHYEQRMQQDLDLLHDRVADVGRRVESAVADSVRALLSGDRELAASVILGDLPINRAIRAIDRSCHVFVARHLPSAGVLRYVSAVLRVDVAIERIGDYAVTIAREAVQLKERPPASIASDIERMADQSRRELRQALDAFGSRDAELARDTKALASRRARGTFDRVFADLVQAGEGGGRSLTDLFALLIILNRLERVTDQAKNLCEETLFAVTGEVKQAKVYEVLFVDERNDFVGPLAEAIARKLYPQSGRYRSAGWNPATVMDPHMADFFDRKGLEVGNLTPKPLPSDYRDLDDFHVIVGAGVDAAPHLAATPFHTAVIRWDLGESPEAGQRQVDDALLEDLYKTVSARVRELVETLRGEDAG